MNKPKNLKTMKKASIILGIVLVGLAIYTKAFSTFSNEIVAQEQLVVEVLKQSNLNLETKWWKVTDCPTGSCPFDCQTTISPEVCDMAVPQQGGCYSPCDAG